MNKRVLYSSIVASLIVSSCGLAPTPSPSPSPTSQPSSAQTPTPSSPQVSPGGNQPISNPQPPQQSSDSQDVTVQVNFPRTQGTGFGVTSYLDDILKVILQDAQGNQQSKEVRRSDDLQNLVFSNVARGLGTLQAIIRSSDGQELAKTSQQANVNGSVGLQVQITPTTNVVQIKTAPLVSFSTGVSWSEVSSIDSFMSTDAHKTASTLEGLEEVSLRGSAPERLSCGNVGRYACLPVGGASLSGYMDISKGSGTAKGYYITGKQPGRQYKIYIKLFNGNKDNFRVNVTYDQSIGDSTNINQLQKFTGAPESCKADKNNPNSQDLTCVTYSFCSESDRNFFLDVIPFSGITEYDIAIRDITGIGQSCSPVPYGPPKPPSVSPKFGDVWTQHKTELGSPVSQEEVNEIDTGEYQVAAGVKQKFEKGTIFWIDGSNYSVQTSQKPTEDFTRSMKFPYLYIPGLTSNLHVVKIPLNGKYCFDASLDGGAKTLEDRVKQYESQGRKPVAMINGDYLNKYITDKPGPAGRAIGADGYNLSQGSIEKLGSLAPYRSSIKISQDGKNTFITKGSKNSSGAYTIVGGGPQLAKLEGSKVVPWVEETQCFSDIYRTIPTSCSTPCPKIREKTSNLDDVYASDAKDCYKSTNWNGEPFAYDAQDKFEDNGQSVVAITAYNELIIATTDGFALPTGFSYTLPTINVPFTDATIGGNKVVVSNFVVGGATIKQVAQILVDDFKAVSIMKFDGGPEATLYYKGNYFPANFDPARNFEELIGKDARRNPSSLAVFSCN